MSDPISFSSITVDADGITGFNGQSRKSFISMEEIRFLEIVRGNVSEWPKLQLAGGILCFGLALVGIIINFLFVGLVVLGVKLIHLSRQKEIFLIVTRYDSTKRLSMGEEIATALLHRFIEDVRRVYGLEITPLPID
ncbi:MAG: hypothetical protein ABIR47_17285 [Candidatus Kapaibacterium sp.]